MASRLIQDNDGHWYMIPFGQDELFWKWVQSMENGTETDLEFDQYRVNGPHTIKILDWEE